MAAAATGAREAGCESERPGPDPRRSVGRAAGDRGFLPRYALLASADVGGKALAYVAMVVVIRHFGAAGYGALSFAAAVVACALTAAACGLEIYAVRETARHPDRLGATIGTVVTLRLLFAATVYAALLAGSLLVPSLAGVAGLLAILGVSLFTGALSLVWVAEGLQRAPVVALANCGTQALSLALVLALIRTPEGVWVAAAAQVIAETAVAAGVFAWVRGVRRGSWAARPRREWRGVVAQSAPMGWSRALRAVTIWSDLVILGLFLPLAEVGWYSGAFRLYLVFSASVGIYSILLLPRLALAATSGEGVWGEVGTSFRRIIPLAVVATLAAAVASEVLLVGLFDSTFAVAAGALRVLLLALLLHLVSTHYRLALIAQGRQGRDSVAVTVATAAHIGLKVGLVPALGLIGAAAGHCLGEACLLGLSWYLARAGTGTAPPAPAGAAAGRPGGEQRDGVRRSDRPDRSATQPRTPGG